MKMGVLGQLILRLKKEIYYGSFHLAVMYLSIKKIKDKEEKYGVCRSIMVSEIAGKEAAILLQNAFPTLEKYISHAHVVNGKPLKVIDSLRDEILDNFRYLLSLKKKGRNLFFTDIDAIKKKILDDIN